MRSKIEIRNHVWELLQKRKAARFPGAKGRIPNFIGAEACAKQLGEIPYWKAAKVLKSNPDSPQRAIRQRALAEGTSIKGAAQYGRPVTLDQVEKIDLVVCGSVAINRQGARVGKGGGYSDLEFALLTEEGKIGPDTPIVTSVHPLQIIDEEIPMTEHDIPLSAIVTPTEVVAPTSSFARPKGIYWRLLPKEKLDDIPVLKARGKNAP